MNLVSSQDRLDMADLEKRNGEVSFTRRNGCYVSRCAVGFFFVAAVCAVIAVSLVVYYLLPCPRPFDESANKDDISDDNRPKPYVLLPRSVVPEHYTIELQPFLSEDKNFTFNGYVKIRVKCVISTDNVTIHANHVEIQQDTVKITRVESFTTTDSSKVIGDVKIARTGRDEKLQFFIMFLEGSLQEGGLYEVEMKYVGKLNDDLVGFYRSSYEENGQKKWLATTQFQATEARRAFPCFDEPALKAKFDIILVRPVELQSISNMPQKKSVNREPGWVADYYETTVPMSTYLLAFVVSDFKSESSPDRKFRVWARKDVIDNARYALDIGPKMLSFFNQYFRTPYPLPKMDMIAVPDFDAGAMENWGLITYRETAMLFQPNASSSANQERVATVVSHELAHQWFGNLVTLKWWDDLWLNEGFASYVQYLGVNEVHKEWKMLEAFIIEEVQPVMELDALKTSHPISQPVHDPYEINEMFDRISYEKGASIIRMMTYFLGENFNKGLTKYLEEKKYGNAVQDELWKFLTDAQPSGKNRIEVKSVMDSWTLQTGYPVVKFTRDYENRKATLTQERFFFEKDENEKETVWKVPITYTDANQPNWDPSKTKLWLNEKSGMIENLPDKNSWIIGNLQEVGYYKVNYDENNWKLLIEQLTKNHEAIHVANRAQIIDDALDLARADYLPYDLALNVTKYLVKEQEFVPWSAATSAFAYLDTMLSRTRVYGKWKKYILKQVEPGYKRLGWNEKDDESIPIKYTRGKMLSWACKLGYSDCIQHAKGLFAQWKTDPKNQAIIKPNFRNIVYSTAIEEGTEEDWDFLWEQYKVEQVAAEKNRMLVALAYAKEPWLISRFLEMGFNSSSGIRRQDGGSVFSAVSSNIFGRDIAFNYMRDNWLKIFNLYGKTSFSISNMVKAATRSLNTRFDLEQLKQFISLYKDQLGASKRAFSQSVEKVDANVKWMEQHYTSIENWLEGVTKGL